MLKLLAAVLIIKKDIRNTLLMFYLQRCKDLYAIAFFQWRRFYAKVIRENKDDLDNLIILLMNKLYYRININPNSYLSPGDISENI